MVADGPREGVASDNARCIAARDIINEVDWPCNVHKNFSEKNLGCRARVESGIDWVFDHVDRAIFLEDDTVVHLDFFGFAEEMLKRYENDLRICSIQAFSGGGESAFDAGYTFSAIHHPWGRAVWRRSWLMHDRSMSALDGVLRDKTLKAIFPNERTRQYWEQELIRTHNREYDAWDYPFNLSCWLQSGLSIVPCRNLVRNAGVGLDSTHTRVDDGQASMPVKALPVQLVHPNHVIRNWRYDAEIMRRFHKFPSLITRVWWKIQIIRFHLTKRRPS